MYAHCVCIYVQKNCVCSVIILEPQFMSMGYFRIRVMWDVIGQARSVQTLHERDIFYLWVTITYIPHLYNIT